MKMTCPGHPAPGQILPWRRMVGPLHLEPSMPRTADPDAIALPAAEHLLAIDAALRHARERVLGAGSLTDGLWAVLAGLETGSGEASFDALDAGPASHLGRQTLLRCLAMLEERGLIEPGADALVPLLTQVRLTGAGRAAITRVSAAALDLLGGRLIQLRGAGAEPA